MRATEDLLTDFFVNGHDGAVEQWEFGDYEGALEEIQSRGIDITKPDKRDAQEDRPGIFGCPTILTTRSPETL